jgi:hypothetical protein
VNVKKALTIQWFRRANANPATPTTRFTKPFKRLVNFLNFRKNTKKASLPQLATARAIRGDAPERRA